MKIIPARCVKRLAYEAGRFVIEIEFISANGRTVAMR
jgi:hypothetical protein